MHSGIPEDVKKKIHSAAITSRILIILLQIAVNPFPNHDAGVFLHPKKVETEKLLDPLIQSTLGGFVRWDAQYFMHITLEGYTYENSVAFFPLLPFIIRGITFVFQPLTTVMSRDSLALLVYIIFNVFVFVQAAKALYRLTAEMFDPKFALKCTLIFCSNPASIFFTAPYTECLFSYLTFSGIYHACKVKSNGGLGDLLRALFYITLSSCVRSNGLLNIGFLLYFYIYRVTESKFKLGSVIRDGFILTLSLGACLVPFAYIQYYFYNLFCTDFNHKLPHFILKYAAAEGLVLQGEFSRHNQSWCYYKLIPLPYQYVQDRYWNVGFLRYYEFKQIPNFLLALPIIYIVLRDGFLYFYKHRDYLLHLGVFKRLLFGGKARESSVFVCVVHAVVLTVFCIFCVHVQVTTRMVCSATPAIYWFAAKRNDRIIKYYCWGYIIVGTVMFTKFLPWT